MSGIEHADNGETRSLYQGIIIAACPELAEISWSVLRSAVIRIHDATTAAIIAAYGLAPPRGRVEKQSEGGVDRACPLVACDLHGHSIAEDDGFRGVGPWVVDVEAGTGGEEGFETGCVWVV